MNLRPLGWDKYRRHDEAQDLLARRILTEVQNGRRDGGARILGIQKVSGVFFSPRKNLAHSSGI